MLKYLLAAVVAITPIAAFADSTVHGLATATTSPLPASSCIYVDQGGTTDTKLCSGWAAALGGLVAANNLSDLTNAGTARTNLGLTALATTTPGTGVATALGTNVGSAGAFITNGGALGTPSSGTATNITGLPISTGVSGLGTGAAAFLATPTSATLSGALTDETGTGAAVFATSPVLVTPALGTPASGVATNLTGLPLTTGVTGILPGANGGTGVANTGFTLTLGGSASLPAAPASTQCLHMANTGAVSATGSDCGAGGGGTPVTFVGNTAGAANTYTIASPTPTGFTLTDQFIVCGSISATNTGASTLSVNGTTATAIKRQAPNGYVALSGGELVVSNQYCFQYNAANTSYVLLTLIINQSPISASSTITAAQWAAWQPVAMSTAAQTITLPVATSLTSNGGLIITTVGNSVTLTPNAADGINGGSIGTSVTIPANLTTVVTTSGASGTGAFNAPLGSGGLTCPTNFTAVNGECAWTVSSPTTTGCGSINCWAWTGLTTNNVALRCFGLQGGNAGAALAVQVGESVGPTWETSSTAYTFNQVVSGVTNGGNATVQNGTNAGFPSPFNPPTSGATNASIEMLIQGMTSTTLDTTAVYRTANFNGGLSYISGYSYYNADTGAKTALRVIDVQGTPVSAAGGSCTLVALGG